MLNYKNKKYRQGRMVVPMVDSTRGIVFECFQGFIASFRVGGVALCHIQTCFNTSKIFLYNKHKILSIFSKKYCNSHNRNIFWIHL